MSQSFLALMRDGRNGWRALGKTPAFTLGAIVTVALAVGSATAIFSVLYGVLLRELPYRQPSDVFWIWSDQPGRDRTPFNVPDFIDYRDGVKMLSGFAGFFAASANLADESAAERVQGIRATGNLFDVLGANARLGRPLRPADEQPGADHVVVVTESFWVRRFGADPSLVGRSIRLNSEEYTVVGVLAGGLAMPVRDIEFVLPFAADRDARRGSRNSFNFIIGVGRVAGGSSRAQAAGELNAIARRLQEQYPVENARKRGVRLMTLVEGIAGSFRTSLWTLFAAVAAVLLVACANLANLMLTRAAARRRDLAVQLAIGASRVSVVRQVVVESLLVSVTGGAGGVLLAQWGLAALVAMAPAELPRANEIRIDTTVMLFSLALSVLTGLLFGVFPAITSSRVDVRDALQGGSRGTTAAGRRLRGALVSAEVALAVALLVVMSMLARSLANVQAVSPGFDAANVLSARLTLPATRFNTRDAIVTFQRALHDQVSAMPGVSGSAAISLVPLSGLLSRVPFTVEGRSIERERVPFAQYRTVSAGYFEAARIPLRRGRTFTDADTGGTRAVAVVSEALAKEWLDGLDPIGARLLVDDNDGQPRPLEIVGVVGNVPQVALDAAPTWDLYVTYPQVHADNVATAANMFWIVRAGGDVMALAPAFARAVRKIDPEVAASQVRPLESYLAVAVAPRRFSVSLMIAFGVAALALALTGIYAVITYAINQRAREIGIRLALGATRTTIAKLILGHGAVSIVVGVVAGTAMAAGAAQLASALLFGVAATDAAIFAQIAVFVALVSLMACAIPTFRVGRLAGGVLRSD